MIFFGKNVNSLVLLENNTFESHKKSTLLNTAACKLKTLINSVASVAEGIESTNISKETEKKLMIISVSCSYSLSLINDFQSFASVFAGSLRVSKIPFNINNTLKDVFSMITIQVKDKNIKFELKTFNLPDLIISDPLRIKQIILRLLNNSKKYTKQGFISLEAAYSDQKLIIKCIDSGIGIPPDKLALLFRNFERNSLYPHEVNKGLGLIISNMLIKKLGGFEGLKVASEPGVGSCFSFSIKVCEIQDNLLEIPEENTKISFPLITIKSLCDKIEVLIVDHSYCNVLGLLQTLKNEGINCSFSLNGEDALSEIKKKDFALVLIDCEMPILNG